MPNVAPTGSADLPAAAEVDNLAGLPAAPSRAEQLYVLFGGVFFLALVVANVFAAQKLIVVDLGFHKLVVAGGILAYPVTFLITDLISEVFGKRRADAVVVTGFVLSLGLLAFIEIGRAVPALTVEQQQAYDAYFTSNTRAILASMVAYVVAQLLDVRLFHFWKRLTNGRHLWLRNNGSTVGSQLVDTVLVTVILFYGVELSGGTTIGTMIRDGFIFKAIVALVDTPLLYVCVWACRKVLQNDVRAPVAELP